MKKLEIYDPAMCCSTGVCGPEVDPVLVQFAADLKWVAEQGVTVQRYNPAVVKELETGMERLPIVVVDGAIVAAGIYLTRDQLAHKLGLAPVKASGGCNAKSGCC
jgi:hypothetical protein